MHENKKLFFTFYQKGKVEKSHSLKLTAVCCSCGGTAVDTSVSLSRRQQVNERWWGQFCLSISFRLCAGTSPHWCLIKCVPMTFCAVLIKDAQYYQHITGFKMSAIGVLANIHRYNNRLLFPWLNARVDAMFHMFPVVRHHVYSLCLLWNGPNLPWLWVLFWLSQGERHSVLSRMYLTCFVQKQLL